MAFGDKILTSIYGRRLGLQPMTTAGFGGSAAGEALVGPDGFRGAVTTETTASNLRAFGQSLITSAASSGVFTIDPPIPGLMEKVVTFNSSGATAYLKTANSETFITTQGTTHTVLKSTQNIPFTVKLVPVSTSVWGVIGGGSSAVMSMSTTT